MARILLTGGAGYVGSHCARLLVSEGYEVVVLDDLSQGYAEAVSGELIQVDLRDQPAVRAVLERGFDCVLHFAGLISVAESVRRPMEYWDVNVGGTLSLVGAMLATGHDRLVFSSTAAVYGQPEKVPLEESDPLDPINPYGYTKAAIEHLLDQEDAAGRLRSARLRYFNACGASTDAWIGEAHAPETHLIPVALERARRGLSMTIFGSDYPTRDGTCVRDYVHVLDLADAHLAAVRHLLEGGDTAAWNLGSGHGYSVREVLDAVDAVTGSPLERVEAPRRPGDPPVLLADPSRAARELGWRARRSLVQAVEDAWKWQRAPRFGPGSGRSIGLSSTPLQV